MEKVTGIGGLFFRAGDPEALGRWYRDHLGVSFGAPHQAWMVNFRVRDLAAITDQLAATGVNVTVDPEQYPNGGFARLHDPEGNPIELWEPRGAAQQ